MPLSTVESDRTVLYTSRAAVEDAAYVFFIEQQKYLDAVRLFGAGDPRAIAAKAAAGAAESALFTARGAATTAGTTLLTDIASYLGTDPRLDATHLDATVPLLLFPVRVETKFDVAGRKLLVRVYPDEIVADTHEPMLTDDELAAGQRYLALIATEGEPATWAALASQYGPTRAAFIVATVQSTSTPRHRSHSWTRGPEARVLPDRFIVLAYRGGAVVQHAFGAIIPEPLPLALSPDRGLSTTPLGTGGPPIDDASRWVFDFTQATAVGMAMTITALTDTDLSTGFDRVIVLGVKASMGPAQSKMFVEQLVDAHHYTNGVEVLAQGTPTNNTSMSPAAFDAPDPGSVRSFAIERAPATPPSGDGILLASSLGISTAVLDHVAGAHSTQQAAAAAMNEALWPATLGYFLEQMMNAPFAGAPVNVGPGAVQDARGYFRSWVRGRGPLPAVRFGRVPYGVLPVTSVQHWTVASGATVTETNLPDLLKRAHGTWMSATGAAPRIGRTGDPDRDLLETMGVDASTREVRVRQAFGPDMLWNLLGLLGQDADTWFATQAAFGTAVLTLINHVGWLTRISGMNFGDNGDPLALALVDTAPLSESAGLSYDYVTALRGMSVAALQTTTLPGGHAVPPVLLFHLLRHAVLEEYARIALESAIKGGQVTEAQRMEAELVKLTTRSIATDTIWERMARVVPSITGTQTLGQWLSLSAVPPHPPSQQPYADALATIAALPTAELERVFTETLDLCSHRWDAWATSLATKRAADMRATAPTGVQLGAYGWAENVRPAAVTTQTLPDGRVVRVYTDPASATPEDYRPGGYVHAPSANHATAAAVLRNAFLTRRGEAAGRFALDLSSQRVREALELLQEIRNGQPLGAVLGYLFERVLHEAGWDGLIDDYRALYPLVARKAETTTEPVEMIAARDVVDIVALNRARDAGTFVFPAGFLPPLVPPPDPVAAGAAVQAALDRVDALQDATADLLTAESVYQAVQGNTSSAGATLDSLGRGAAAPDPEIVRTRRSGESITHRLAMVFPAVVSSPWSGIPATPRAKAEPTLNAWIGSVLGDPANIRCRATFVDGMGHTVTSELAVGDLGIQAYDALAALAGDRTAGSGSELQRRFIARVLATDAGATGIAIDYGRDPTWDPKTIRSVHDAAELASALQDVLSSAHPLAAQHLAMPEATGVTFAPVDWPASIQTLVANAQAGALGTAASLDTQIAAGVAADVTTLRASLNGAALEGVPASFPLSLTGSGDAERSSLLAQATSVSAELHRRHDASVAAGVDSGAAARALFGRDFVLLPSVTLTDATELSRAITLTASASGTPADRRTWFQQIARVRAPVGRMRRLGLLATALTGMRLDISVAQLPAGDAPWAALPFPESSRPPPRTVSLELYSPVLPIDAAQPWRGLLIDEWNERIPSETEDTSIALHYDDPGSEAPQRILLAVPPALGTAWTADSIAAVLNETLDLARIRAVDAELLSVVGQYLPAIYLSGNFEGETISTVFDPTTMLRADPPFPSRVP